MVQAPLFPTRLKAARLACGLTQADVGKALGVSQARVSVMELGAGQPYGGQVFQLANLFGCTTDWLLGRSDDGAPQALAPSTTTPSSAEVSEASPESSSAAA